MMAQGKELLTKLQPISEKGVIDSLIREGIKTVSPAFFWTRSEPSPVPVHLQLYKKGDVTLRITKPTNLNLKKSAQSKDYFFNLSLMSANVFFKVSLIGSESETLLFQAPDIVFKVQRRSSLRVSPTEMDLFQVSFQHPIHPKQRVHRNVWEIGEKGVSFLVPVSEKALFSTNQRLKNFSFTLNNSLIQGEAEVRNVKIHSKKSEISQVRIGVLFFKLAPAASQVIAQYVGEKWRGYFSKKFF